MVNEGLLTNFNTLNNNNLARLYLKFAKLKHKRHMKKTTIALFLALSLASCYTEKECRIEAESAQFSIQTDTTYHKSEGYVLRLVKAKSYTIKTIK